MIDANLIVLCSFSLFMFFALKYGYKKAIHGLDHKINEVRNTLLEAEERRQSALAALQAEQRQHTEIIQHIDQMVQQKQEEFAHLKEIAEQEIAVLLESRRHNADLVFDKIRVETIQSIKKTVTDSTVMAIQNIVQTHFSPEQHQHLNDASIAQIQQFLGENTKNIENTQKKTVQMKVARG